MTEIAPGLHDNILLSARHIYYVCIGFHRDAFISSGDKGSLGRSLAYTYNLQVIQLSALLVMSALRVCILGECASIRAVSPIKTNCKTITIIMSEDIMTKKITFLFLNRAVFVA